MPAPVSRIACLFVPLFPLAARLRSEPELAGEAVAIFEGNGNAAHVIAATRAARQAGIVAGLTLPQARSLYPKLIARGRDRESERAASEVLFDVALTFSPRVEGAGGNNNTGSAGGNGIVYFDATGIERHFPGQTHERDLGCAAIAAARAAALPVRVGIAASKLAARVAAGLPGTPETPMIVAAGEEARFLDPLPLARLCPEIEIASALERWGIRSIGALARLPEAEVASRLGELGRALHASARGRDPRPLVPLPPPLSFREGMDLEWPLVTLEPFLFMVRAALERLTARLEARGLACTRLALTLQLEPEKIDARSIEPPAPTRDVKTLLTLLRLGLEKHSPGAPICGFTLEAHPDRPRRAQLSLFGPAALSPDKLATAIARLAVLVGADCVGSPRLSDGYRPERFALAVFEPPPPPEVARPPRAGRGLLAVRVLRPAVELEVLADELEKPQALSRPPAKETPQMEIHGAVRVASGPWNLEEEWWSEAPVAREYWDVELANGGLYRIFRDRASGNWYADGVYD